MSLALAHTGRNLYFAVRVLGGVFVPQTPNDQTFIIMHENIYAAQYMYGKMAQSVETLVIRIYLDLTISLNPGEANTASHFS
ncbi:hypothetical protein NDU88_006784 [Pleurodeles waltl]|uniref:Uncharacterized protein n=1 Tax=Pleurodeles waltl TaxID=8319 RepID=A0AAV7SQU0_PLEWA|nr:hypothetical protein NDU88_006784 [Pleurodeles waltl]